MSKLDRRAAPPAVGSDTQPIVTLETVKPWRDALTVDDLATIAAAQAYADFWAGVQNNDIRLLVVKLAAMLDGKRG